MARLALDVTRKYAAGIFGKAQTDTHSYVGHYERHEFSVSSGGPVGGGAHVHGIDDGDPNNPNDGHAQVRWHADFQSWVEYSLKVYVRD